MIEAMEQQIVNSIQGRWTKDKEKRREIDIDRMTESLRVICSSRSTMLSVIYSFEDRCITIDEVEKMEKVIGDIYDWITKETIGLLIEKYNSELKDEKKMKEFKDEVPVIINELNELKNNVIKRTAVKLLDFYKIQIQKTLLPSREYTLFNSEKEKIEKLKQWNLISPKATEIKKLYYKGAYTQNCIESDVVGFVDDNEIVIELNGQLHCIHPEYFADMQQKKGRIIIVDIETPKSFRSEDGIREVAAIVVEEYKVIDELHLAIVKDKNLYKQGYGAGLEDIQENQELKNQFTQLIKSYNCPLVAHNARFDRRILNYWGWVDEGQEFYCSLETIKAKEKLSSYKLSYLLEYYSIKDNQEHTAMQDVYDLLEVLKKVKPKKWISISNIEKNKKDDHTTEKLRREENKQRLEIAKQNIMSDILKDKAIVFTGEMNMSRVEIQDMAIRNGAIVSNSITKKTNLLVVGDEPGSTKLNKAKQDNIEIISEDDFFNIINKSIK